MTAPVQPDPVVRAALQLLPIPPHGDEFWTRLEASLDAEVPVPLPVEPRPTVLIADAPPIGRGAPAPIEPARDTSLTVVPPAFRRASNVVLVAVAAAAVVVVAIAGNALLEERRSVSGVASGGPSADAALETLVRGARDDATVTTLSERHERSSTDAVLAWVDDLGRGDAHGAWAAMGEVSQGHFASEGEFRGMLTDLAEGYGAWSTAEPDDVLVMPVRSGDDGTIAVVTLVGDVEQEGVAHERTDAFPVRLAEGEVVLEPFASAGDLEVVIPEPLSDDEADGYEVVGLQEELIFVLPTSVEAPVLRIDGGDTVVCGEAPGTDLHDLEGTTGQRCSYLPEGGFGPGEHLVTVAFVADDGKSVTADSLRFAAA